MLDLGEEQAALDRGEELADAGAEVAAGDLEVPASLDDAMKGVSAVVLVSPAVPAWPAA